MNHGGDNVTRMRLRIISSSPIISMLLISVFAGTIFTPVYGAQIALNTNKDVFSADDLVQITGNVSDSPSQLVGIEVKDPEGNTILVRTVQTDNDGNFALIFKVPLSAKPGNFGITANGEVGGVSVTKMITVSGSQEPEGGGCLIATAAFGSELSPQVQFLRNFRDGRILSTAAGSSFMNVFNMWYYSFSPNVADAEREIPVLQQTIKYAIYPLLGILTVAEKIYSVFNGEAGAVTAGFVTSSMLGFIYFWPIAYGVGRVNKGRRLGSRTLVYAILISLVAVGIVILLSDPILLMITTPAFVLTVVTSSAIISSRLIERIIRK